MVVPGPQAASPIQLEVVRIRELSKLRRHTEALASAEALAWREPQNRDALYLVAANQRCLNQITELQPVVPGTRSLLHDGR